MVGWNSLKYFVSKTPKLKTSVSVIVPFYNEGEQIQRTLLGLLQQNIQTIDFEVLAINDGSTDDSVAIVELLEKSNNRLKLIHNSGKGKKEAIACGIAASNSELIVTTDADCSYQPQWLETMVSYYESYSPGLIIGPVAMERSKGIFQRFQLLEFNSLIMSTGGAAGIGHPIMCNGANLAFKKELFERMDDPMKLEYLSGDDVFLLHNIKRETDAEIHFLKSHHALVTTKSEKKLKAFLRQRERWTSKASGYTDADTLFSASIVFGTACLFMFGLFMLIFNIHFAKPLVFLFAVKLFIDFLFFHTTESFFKHRMYFIYLMLFEFVYNFYVFIVGVQGLWFSNRWKK